MTLEKILIFAFGVIFVSVILVLTVLIDNPTPQQYAVFKTVLALAAAGVGAMLPGLLELQVNNFVRAGGAMAIFAVVYFYSPAAIEQVRKIVNPKGDADITLVDWFKRIDDGEYESAYNLLCDDAKAFYKKEQLISLFANQRGPLGAVKKRAKSGIQGSAAPAYAKPGTYMIVSFITSFDKKPGDFFENIMLQGTPDRWIVCEHNLQPKPF